jgi:dihydrofolate reductase
VRKIISFVHISLDGFVAGPNGEMNWIKVDEEIFEHVGKRIAKTNTAMYGRKTYDMMQNYWPTAADKPDASRHDIDHSKWYKDVRKIVLSKTLNEDLPNTEIISDNIAERLDKIKQSGENEILLFGSPTATHAIMQHGLIDGYWLFVNPVILGQGIPLFKHIREKSKLNLQSTHQFKSGVVELNYVVAK